jgi:hypothetical protein
MPFTLKEIFDYGAVVVVVGMFLLAWIKSKQNGGGFKEAISELRIENNRIAENLKTENASIANELKIQNENHLVHIDDNIIKLCNSVQEGNTELVKAINDNGKILTEIRGLLSRR